MTQLDTTCPTCGAPHARKLSVIHSEGISTVQTNIDTVGKYNTIGGAKIKTKGTANGTQQTQASKDAAPPVVPQLVTRGMWIRGGVISVGVVFCIGGVINAVSPVALLGVVIIVASFGIPAKPTEVEQNAYGAKTKHLREAKDAWANTFQCSACGNRFVPSSVRAA